VTGPRQRVPSGTPWDAVVGYSRAVRVGPHVAVAGTAAVDENGDVVGPGDAYAQTAFALLKVEAALVAVGATLDDVVRTRIYVTDIAQWEAVGRAHGEAFGDVRPATTMVQVARLIADGLMVEIEADAIVTDAP
jgi:enamine deaminase RidA (YjgF/YER057c/UK114 family)